MSVRESFRELIRACAQCGTCAAACPTSQASDFHVRKLTRRLQLDVPADLERTPWLCTQCGRCTVVCEERLDLPGLVTALRREAIGRDLVPEAARTLAATIRATGSPYRSLSRKKSSWSDGRQRGEGGSGTLFWAGCTPSMMAPAIARAAARVLDRACGGFGLLDEEPCCGEPLVALGLHEEARQAAQKARQAILDSGVTRVVTSCAGCYSTFTRSYPQQLGLEVPGVEFAHLSQLLARDTNGALRLDPPMRVTYHDPCSLGRHCGVYEEPRKVLRSIAGLELVEIDPAGELGLCCGAGGGLWSIDRRLATEIASRTIERSCRHLGVEALVTTCPMCVTNFRHALRRMRSPLAVLELGELVARALRE